MACRLLYPAVMHHPAGLPSDMPKKTSSSVRSLGRRSAAEYDEETFLHLLAIEQARADRARRRLRLLLATLEPVAGRPVPFSDASALRLFAGLKQLLRDTDFMGWYRHGLVAGAVLAAPGDEEEAETAAAIEKRVEAGLRRTLPPRVANELRVRVTQQGPRPMNEHSTASRR